MSDLIVRDLEFSYTPTGNKVLDGVSFNLSVGDRLWVSGANGSGKTTLLSVLSGLRSATSGQAVLSGQPLTREDTCLVPTTPPLYDELDPLEHIGAAADMWGLPKKDIPKYSRCVFGRSARLNLDLDHRLLGAYSTGMKEKFAFSLLTSLPARVLLLDEPFTTMDQKSRIQAIEILRSEEQDKIIVFTSHLSIVSDNLSTSEYRLGQS